MCVCVYVSTTTHLPDPHTKDLLRPSDPKSDFKTKVIIILIVVSNNISELFCKQLERNATCTEKEKSKEKRPQDTVRKEERNFLW